MNTSKASGSLAQWIESQGFQYFITALIVINAVILGLQTSPDIMQSYGTLLTAIDMAILSVFVIELLLRLFVYRINFFKDPWSIFDFIVVTIALIPASGPFSVLRAFRVLRVLRLISVSKSMRTVISALLQSLPGLASIVMLLLLIFYVAAVMATTLFSATFPQWFGSIGDSLYSLFQIMTLESWSMGIVRPVMEQHPAAWAFFVPFILLATFTMLNLFIAVVVNAMQTKHEMEQGVSDREALAEAHDEREAMHDEIVQLRREIRALSESIQAQKNTK
ncbi:ion transporter [Marinicella sp. W31]|uniref:ion transporter n=1 Tax=Marinicella sp. W31 TaxID=3023713 RepID=UPI0037567BED